MILGYKEMMETERTITKFNCLDEGLYEYLLLIELEKEIRYVN